MKVTHSNSKEFTPVEIKLVCETQDEVNAICGLFNSSVVMAAVRRGFNLPDLYLYRGLETLKTTKGNSGMHQYLTRRS